MAVTANITRSEKWGRRRAKIGTLTFDSSYPSGGEPFDPGTIGLIEINYFDFAQGEDGQVFHWDAANEKILVFGVEQDADGSTTDALDEEDDTADLSGVVVEFLAVGK